MPKGFRSATVQELIDALTEARDEFGGETKVTFASSYGDYGRTQQVHSLGTQFELRAIEATAYSDSGYCLKRESEDGPDDCEVVLVME